MAGLLGNGDSWSLLCTQIAVSVCSLAGLA